MNWESRESSLLKKMNKDKFINDRYYTFIYKSTILIKEKKMPSDRGITAYLEEEDFELFQMAVKKYGMDKSKLIKEIIHGWLFSNKLQLKK